MFALGVFVIILVISAIVAWQMRNYKNYDQGSFHTFISILMGLGVFVTFMFYYAIVEEQQEQRTLASVQQLSTLNASLINSILKEINNATPFVPNFVASVNPLTMTKTSIPDLTTPEAISYKTTLAYRIFAVWQDNVVTQKFLGTYDSIAYLCNFLQRANSKELFEIWTRIHIDFSTTTQNFGNLLFEYGLPIAVQQSRMYEDAANALSQDPRYQQIFT